MNWEAELYKVNEPCELFFDTNESIAVNFNDKKLSSIDYKENSDVAFRLIKDRKMGFASGSGGTSFDVLYKSALQGADYGKSIDYSFVNGDGKEQVWSEIDPAIDKVTDNEIIDLGNSIISRINKEKPEYNCNTSFVKGNEKVQILTNSGAKRSFTRNYFGMGFELDKTGEGDMIQLHHGANHLPSEEELERMLEQTFQNASYCENVVSMDTGKYPVVFHPISFTFLWQPLFAAISANAVYDKISPLKNKLNEKILSEKITIIDDPLWKNGDNFGQFDDEGVLAKKRNVIENGVLKTFLNNLDYANRLNMEPTGHGFRKDWLTNSRKLSGSPSILPTNRIMLPGNENWKDMIKSVDKGLLLWYSLDCWIGNLINGDFSGTVDLGFKIEKGKIAGRVKNLRLSGNIYSLFNECVEAISSHREHSLAGYDYFPYMLCRDVALSG